MNRGLRVAERIFGGFFSFLSLCSYLFGKKEHIGTNKEQCSGKCEMVQRYRIISIRFVHEPFLLSLPSHLCDVREDYSTL